MPLPAMSSQDACLGYLGAVLFGKKKKPEIKLGSGKRERVRKARGERDTGKTGWWSLPSPS